MVTNINNDLTIAINGSVIECDFNNSENMVVQLNNGDHMVWSFGLHGHSDYAVVFIKEDHIFAEIVRCNNDPDDAWETMVDLAPRITLGELLLEHINLPVNRNDELAWRVQWDDIS